MEGKMTAIDLTELVAQQMVCKVPADVEGGEQFAEPAKLVTV
jgi:hypothetical protein